MTVPAMNVPNTIENAAAAIRAGGVKSADLVDFACQRIARFEPQIRAWALVDEAGARAAAAQLDEEAAAGVFRGPLHGIPLGIKDIIDVAGMPTLAGSPLRAGHLASEDAPVVRQLRDAGAVILGKTVTCEFAGFDPSVTRNPWNLDCTPGGSSSGSAAAVAAGMCLGAIGSQTGGSITRPATYCGVAGCKPTFGLVSRQRVVPVSFHLDHVGPIAGTVADLAILLGAMAGPRATAADGDARIDYTAGGTFVRPPRLAFCEEFFLERAEGEVRQATRAAIDLLRDRGARIEPAALPENFAEALVMHRRIMAVEAARYHAQMFATHRSSYGEQMTELLDEGLAMRPADYQQALQHQDRFREKIVASFADVDALVTPATTSPAPADLHTTGSPAMNSPWSYAGVPTVSIPSGLVGGRPFGLQFIGNFHSEQKLLGVAAWCEGQVGFRRLADRGQ